MIALAYVYRYTAVVGWMIQNWAKTIRKEAPQTIAHDYISISS
jgi:hypothetical protein